MGQGPAPILPGWVCLAVGLLRPHGRPSHPTPGRDCLPLGVSLGLSILQGPGMPAFRPPSFADLQRMKTSIQAPLPMVALCSLGCDSPVPRSALASAGECPQFLPDGGDAWIPESLRAPGIIN